MTSVLLDLMLHMRWADSLIAAALERATPHDAESERIFAHIAGVEHLWYSRIQERPATYAVWPPLTVEEAKGVAAVHADLFEQLVRDSDADALARRIAYRNSAGFDFASTVAEIVTHTAMHGSHHRGQIVRLLRTAGHEPPYVDYFQYTRRDQLP
jgi:uncharacterized damage-inducible protein DinB